MQSNSRLKIFELPSSTTKVTRRVYLVFVMRLLQSGYRRVQLVVEWIRFSFVSQLQLLSWPHRVVIFARFSSDDFRNMSFQNTATFARQKLESESNCGSFSPRCQSLNCDSANLLCNCLHRINQVSSESCRLPRTELHTMFHCAFG